MMLFNSNPSPMETIRCCWVSAKDSDESVFFQELCKEWPGLKKQAQYRTKFFGEKNNGHVLIQISPKGYPIALLFLDLDADNDKFSKDISNEIFELMVFGDQFGLGLDMTRDMGCSLTDDQRKIFEEQLHNYFFGDTNSTCHVSFDPGDQPVEDHEDHEEPEKSEQTETETQNEPADQTQTKSQEDETANEVIANAVHSLHMKSSNTELEAEPVFNPNGTIETEAASEPAPSVEPDEEPDFNSIMAEGQETETSSEPAPAADPDVEPDFSSVLAEGQDAEEEPSEKFTMEEDDEIDLTPDPELPAEEPAPENTEEEKADSNEAVEPETQASAPEKVSEEPVQDSASAEENKASAPAAIPEKTQEPAKNSDLPQVSLYVEAGTNYEGTMSTGWASILYFKGHKKVFSGSSAEKTCNEALLESLIEALSALKKKSSVTVISSLSYLTKPFTEGWFKEWKVCGFAKPEKNADLWSKLDKVMANHEITFQWQPGSSDEIHSECCNKALEGQV